MKDSHSAFLDQMLVSGGNFLTLSICAHFLPMSEQGKFVYVFSCYLAALLINVSGIFQGAAVKAPELNTSFKVTLARLQVIQGASIAIFIGFIWFIFSKGFDWQISLTSILLLVLFLFLQQLADFDRRSAYIFSTAKKACISSASLYPARILVLFLFQPTNLNEVLFILAASALFPAYRTFILAFNAKNIKEVSWFSGVGEHLKYSKYFLAASLTGWAWSNTPIFLLGAMIGSESAGLLASIRGIANVANVLMEQLETRGSADWGRQYHQKGISALNQSVTKMKWTGIILWLIALVSILIFGEKIVLIALGKSYADHWYLLIISWIAYGVYFISRIDSIQFRTFGNNKIEFYSGVFGVMAAICFSAILIPLLQVTGAAYSFVAIAVTLYISQILADKIMKSKSLQ